MNYYNELDLKYSKSKVNCWAILAIISMVLVFSSCEKDCECPEDTPEEYPSLKVVNQLDDYWRPITKVSLIGYEFNNLNIEPNGDSQTFILDEGMTSGYEDINVTVRYIRYSGVSASASIKVDFDKGETTRITLTGCSGAEGCQGIYLE